MKKHTKTLTYEEIKKALEGAKLPETTDINRHINIGMDRARITLLGLIADKALASLEAAEEEE